MNQQLTVQTIAVGVDVHKYGHVAAATTLLNHDLGSIKFDNQTIDNFKQWLTQLTVSKDHLLIGLEDVDSYGQTLAKALMADSYEVRYVPAKLTDYQRRHSTHKDKTDNLDAKRVAKAMIQKLEETLPVDLILSDNQEQLKTLDWLLQERSQLVKDQTELKNQLHTLLHQYFGDNYRFGFKDPFGSKAIKFYLEKLDVNNRENMAKLGFMSEAVRRRLLRLQLIISQIKQLKGQIHDLIKTIQVATDLTNIDGCGELTAGQIAVEIKNIKRFESESKLARYGGLAPVAHSSGDRNRLYTDRGGNRKFNLAIHRIALSQIGIRKKPEADSYYHKKIKEGKSKLFALRCLKRQIVKQVYRQLNGSI